MIYLASPYSFPATERARRYRLALFAMGHLITKGFHVYCPVVHTHAVNLFLAGQKCEPPPSFWYGFEEPFMNFCDRLVVLQIMGWRKSKGVEREISHFWNKRYIKAEFMHPQNYKIHELPWPLKDD